MTAKQIVMQEAKRLLLGMAPLTLIAAGLFFLAGMGDLRTIGSLLGGAAYSFILFLMIGANASKALLYPAAQAIGLVRRGYMFRYCLTGVLVFLTFKLPFINPLAAILPLFFPKIILLANSIFRKKGG
ncbi:ATP synthase subunit I [Intestinibacillus massiliensis]|uniref:ATP synthase subunit I n=1 Tax=Intestinibacillus massiliensis TaxID=1871029 RepID=UPI000B358125|nr:ATP synthase subunit I [Intestinibacillus massiliensis]